MDALEARLADAQWLGGQLPSGEDRELWLELGGQVPSPDTHPNTFAWWALVSRFTDDVRNGWKDAGAPAKGGKKAAPKKEEPKKAAAAADDDDFDPFADGGEDDADVSDQLCIQIEFTLT